MAKTIKRSAAELADKWARRTSAAVPDIVKGISLVTESPMEKAAAKQEKMLQNLTKSVQDGKWKSGLLSVSTEEWKAKTTKKVQERLAGGVEAAKGKRQKFDEHNIAVVNAGLAKIDKLPDLTLDQNLERMTTFVRHMSENPYKK